MSPEWKIFLEHSGAVIEDGAMVNFGNPAEELQALTSQTIICPLSHHGLIAATGTDAETFLQGQFSNDVREVSEQHSQLSAYCSPKGRVLALFRLFKRADSYYISLPYEILEPTLKRLRLFVLRSQVTLVDASDKLIAIGLAGSDAEAILKNVLGELPQAVDSSLQIKFAGGNITIIHIPSAQPRFEIYGELNSIKTLWTSLAGRAMPVGAIAWKLLEIRSGIPTIHPATVDAFVPQMINLQDINAVSFNKGCYPGQEIVARMHYLGTLKRRMYHACGDAPIPPQPGDELYTSANEQSIGQVVDAEMSPQGGFELLAVVQIASAEREEVRLYSRQGLLLQFSNQGQEKQQ